MIEAETLESLNRSFAAAFSHEDPMEARRRLLEAGWPDVLDEDPPAAIALVFTLQGATGRDVGALDDVLLRRAEVVDAVRLDAIAVAHPGHAGRVLLPGRPDVRQVLWLPDLPGGGAELIDLEGPLDTHPVRGLDPALGLRGVVDRPAGHSAPLPEAGRWDHALAAGRIAAAYQIIAGARVLLDMASDYATMRKQFGVPIGSFQAVKHRLAETLVAISAAEATALAASTTCGGSAAAVAKAMAGRAGAVAGKHCLQVFGGIGFTSDHNFHHFFRRNLVLDRLLGDGRAMERELGATLRSGRMEEPWGVELDKLARLELLISTNRRPA